MKSVLISIHPKWSELIASGKKTVEVRKTRPKIDVPFKCYIYETKGKTDLPTFIDEDGHEIYQGRGQVIGEFVCNTIFDLHEAALFAGMDEINKSVIEEYSCVDIDELLHYKGNKNKIYGWSISELVIYDKPKELSEFVIKGCKGCRDKDTYHCKFHCRMERRIKRPPQSWCYVEKGGAE